MNNTLEKTTLNALGITSIPNSVRIPSMELRINNGNITGSLSIGMKNYSLGMDRYDNVTFLKLSCMEEGYSAYSPAEIEFIETDSQGRTHADPNHIIKEFVNFVTGESK